MNYEIKIRKKARKFIEKQEKKQQERIFRAIFKLPAGDVIKMQGYDDLYRLRVGDYRILFEMFGATGTVTLVEVTDADNRGQVYK